MKPNLVDLRPLLLALGSIAVITYVCFRLLPSSPTTVAFLLLLVVLLTAVSTCRSLAIFTALIATVCLDIFFFPPIGSVTVADPQDWIALVVFCAICLVAGNLSNQLRAQRDSLLEHHNEAEKLHTLSQSLLMISAEDDPGRLILNRCVQLFDLEQFALFETSTQQFHWSNDSGSFPEAAMRQASRQCEIDLNGIHWNVVPITLGNISLGSMAYARHLDLSASTINSLAGTVALALARIQAQEEATRTQAMRRSEELKSVMIDALAHDLKTPLTSIDAAADMLAGSGQLSPAQAGDMVAVIREETARLKRLVDEAIHLARIDAKRLKLELRSESVTHLVQSAVASLGDKTALDRIQLQVSPDIAPVLVDTELMCQALKQLIDNALKYGPPRSSVIIHASGSDGAATISVRDSGPGLTELEQSKVFDKFYRGRYDRSAIQGTGMGLSIAREIAEAHGGSLGVRSHVGQGTEFFLSLKTVPIPQVVNA